ncbi:hypothetical protein NP493_1174g00048 [Ridgeia piscesae]|uniref:ABC transporter TMD0 domain-containing protein n=1 Tax=Ridgeia piscesae TaxID=27915 RepID=A0AAD9KEM7_RIDPI|nr:hypothetical protein NP493_1174g00048 [Ridgeia piscesae]
MDFTVYFQSMTLTWLPCVYLCLCSFYYVPALMTRSSCSDWSDTSRHNAVKFVLGTCLCVVAAVDLVKTLADCATGEHIALAKIVKCVLYVATMGLATFLIHYEFRKGVISGGVLFFYWLSLTFTGFVTFLSNLIRLKHDRQGVDDTEMFHVVVFYVSYGLAFLQLLLSLFSDVAARPEFRRSDKERQPLISPAGSQVPNVWVIAKYRKSPLPEFF